MGSWRLNPLEDNRSLTYLELADELAAYVLDMGFTHVELLPVMAHPFSGSWGYQVTGYFAPDAALRQPGRLPRVRRPAARPRHRRDPRLGARALPARRLGARALRRHRALRARRSAARRASRLGHAGLQLRPQRGAQLPRRQRACTGCATTTPTASASTRSPRCSTSTTRARTASGCRTSSAATRTSRRSSSSASSTRSSTARAPGDDLGRRGVDGVAGRLAPDLPRRAGLRLQVEHGLDARHAGVLPAGPRVPPLPPPRADLRLVYAYTRALHPAALARRGRARQGLAAHTRCRATAGRSSRTCARCTRTCGRTPARSCCSWARSSPRSAEWNHERRSTGTCSRTPDHVGMQRLVARPQPHLQATSRRCGARLRPARASVGSRPTTPTTTSSRSPAVERRRRASSCASRTFRPCRATTTDSACRAAAVGRARRHRLQRSTEGPTPATAAACRRAGEWHGEPLLGRAAAAAAGRDLDDAGRGLTPCAGCCSPR